MTDLQEYNELLGIKAMAEMLIDRADRLIQQKKKAGVSTPANLKQQKKVNDFLLMRKIKRERKILKLKL